MMDDDLDKKKVDYWKKNEGFFVIVDYIYNKIGNTAKGKLESVSLDGNVIIRNLKNPSQSWSFNLLKVDIENSKFETIKEENKNGNMS